MSYICQTCGKEHTGTPRDIGFRRPAEYFTLPGDERGSRCKITEDWCVIDDRRFFIRGVLLVPILEEPDHFAWGVWAEVSQQDFETYYANYDRDGSSIPPFAGSLSGEPSSYAGLAGHGVRIRLGRQNDRPEFTLVPSDHLLYREQQNGISLHRIVEILHSEFPNDYPDPTNT